MAIVERLVPDLLWEAFQEVAPVAPARPQGGGRHRSGDREVLAAVVFAATSGCTWRQLPPVFGPSWQTVYRRFAEWTRARVWAELQRLLSADPSYGQELDWSRRAVESIAVRSGRTRS